jgi:hypothetical protein
MPKTQISNRAGFGLEKVSVGRYMHLNDRSFMGRLLLKRFEDTFLIFSGDRHVLSHAYPTCFLAPMVAPEIDQALARFDSSSLLAQ